MHLSVRLFAVLRDLAGTDRLTVELPEGCRACDLRAAVGRQVPALAPHLEAARVAIDLQFAPESAPIRADQELALIPPVSGG